MYKNLQRKKDEADADHIRCTGTNNWISTVTYWGFIGRKRKEEDPGDPVEAALGQQQSFRR